MNWVTSWWGLLSDSVQLIKGSSGLFTNLAALMTIVPSSEILITPRTSCISTLETQRCLYGKIELWIICILWRNIGLLMLRIRGIVWWLNINQILTTPSLKRISLLFLATLSTLRLLLDVVVFNKVCQWGITSLCCILSGLCFFNFSFFIIFKYRAIPASQYRSNE